MGNSRNRRSLQVDPLVDRRESSHRNTDSLRDSYIQASVTQTATLRPTMHIRKESLKLVHGESTCITFIYDSHNEVIINAYFFASEALKNYGVTECFYVDFEKYPRPVNFEMPRGFNQKFTENMLTINLSDFTVADLTFVDNKVCPLIIEIVRFK